MSKTTRVGISAVLAGLLLFGLARTWRGKAPVPTPPAQVEVKPQSGLYGTVKVQEGDCMPSIGNNKDCRTTPVSRTVYFYQPPLPSDSVDGVNYKGEAKPVATARSDDAGKYQLDLPAGKYSVMADDTDWPFCNQTSEGAACGLVVTGEPQQYDIMIDHAAH